jgi:hypothetical protein
MSDYRNPDDPLRRATRYDFDARRSNATWGWIAGAVVVVVVLAIVFGLGHAPNQAGTNKMANNTPPPPATQTAPAPKGPANPAYSPAPLNPTKPSPRP